MGYSSPAAPPRAIDCPFISSRKIAFGMLTITVQFLVPSSSYMLYRTFGRDAIVLCRRAIFDRRGVQVTTIIWFWTSRPIEPLRPRTTEFRFAGISASYMDPWCILHWLTHSLCSDPRQLLEAYSHIASNSYALSRIHMLLKLGLWSLRSAWPRQRMRIRTRTFS